MKTLYKDLLACPKCKSKLHKDISNNLICTDCNKVYSYIKNKLFLIKDDNDIFQYDDYKTASNSSLESSYKGFFLLPSLSNNFSYKKIMMDINKKIIEDPSLIVLVIGAGNQKNNFLNHLSNHDKCIFTDIDISSDIDFFSDAHEIPLIDSSVDIIITTAVLEHIIDPIKAVREKTRVLKDNGLIYSEMPFMQQVHEGAYDFTRLTLSGHRRLFNNFKEIDSGICAGPGTALAWTLENFILAFISSKFLKLRKVIKLFTRFTFFWFKYFDYILVKDISNADSSSCTFFYGKKSRTIRSDKSIIDSYNGKKHFEHL